MLRALIVVLLAILPLASASAQDGARAATTATVTSTAVRAPATCQNPTGGLGVARIVEIDTAAGPLFGKITKEEKEASFLQPKEVVLTFDDGPMPWITRSILDTLDRFCTKATFFSVGRMALAYPQSLRDVLDRGHTLGGHTWSHPLNLKRLKPERAIDEIERGFAAISIASGGRTSPFFRFPGLSDNAAMLAALQKRGIASFTVDVVSDDSYISDPDRLTRVTLERLEAQRGGIMLFHDIKPATAKALPGILAELQR
ncbi:MAG: polysaccharide deacetylase family protein, partial [Hyphomicrobiaceae bacterium]